MIIDKLLQFSDKQKLASVGTTPSDSTIDFGQSYPNIGMDDHSKVVITMEAFDPKTNALDVRLADSSDGTTFRIITTILTSNGDQFDHDRQIVLPIPIKLRRYCRLIYVKSGNDAVVVSASIVMGIQQNTPYPQSSRIS